WKRSEPDAQRAQTEHDARRTKDEAVSDTVRQPADWNQRDEVDGLRHAEEPRDAAAREPELAGAANRNHEGARRRPCQREDDAGPEHEPDDASIFAPLGGNGRARGRARGRRGLGERLPQRGDQEERDKSGHGGDQERRLPAPCGWDERDYPEPAQNAQHPAELEDVEPHGRARPPGLQQNGGEPADHGQRVRDAEDEAPGEQHWQRPRGPALTTSARPTARTSGAAIS